MIKKIVFIVFLQFIISASFAQNILTEKKIHMPSEKTGRFYSQGIFHNGKVDLSSKLKAIRHAYNHRTGVERIVFDFTTQKVPRIYSYASGKKTLNIDFLETALNKGIGDLNEMNHVLNFDFYVLNGNASLQINFKENVAFDIFYLEKGESSARLVIDTKRI